MKSECKADRALTLRIWNSNIYVTEHKTSGKRGRVLSCTETDTAAVPVWNIARVMRIHTRTKDADWSVLALFQHNKAVCYQKITTA